MLDESAQDDAEEDTLSAVAEAALSAVPDAEEDALSAVPEPALSAVQEPALPKASTSWFKAAKKHCKQCGKASTKLERPACKVCASADVC